MAKKCNLGLLENLTELLRSDPTAWPLLRKIDLAQAEKDLYTSDAWKLIESDTDSSSAYKVLQSYARFKLVGSTIDKTKYINWLVDRIRKFGYEDIPYNKFSKYVNEIEQFSDKQLLDLGFTKDSLQTWQDGIATKVVNEFEYALQVEDTITKIDETINVKSLEKGITSKNMENKLNASFKKRSKKFGDDRTWYQKWLKQVFGKYLWWGAYNISDKMLWTLIDNSLGYDTYADIVSYLYITSWRGRYSTMYKMLDNLEKFKSIRQTQDWPASDFIGAYWSDFDSIKEKRRKLDNWLYENANKKSFDIMGEAVKKSLMIDFKWVNSGVNIHDFVRNSVASRMMLDSKDISKSYIKHTKWQKVIDDLWNPVDFTEFDPHYYFGVDEDMMKNVFALDETLISNFGFSYKLIRNDFINAAVKAGEIKNYKTFNNYMKFNGQRLYDIVAKKIEDWQKNTFSDGLLLIGANANWKMPLPNSSNKRIVVIGDNQRLSSLSTPERKAFQDLNKQNYIITSLTKETTGGVVFYKSLSDAKLNEGDIVLAQDRWDELDQFIQWNLPLNSISLKPAQWLRYSVVDWEIVITAWDEKYIDTVFSWIWQFVSKMKFKKSRTKNVVAGMNKLLKKMVDADNKVTTTFIEWSKANVVEKSINTYKTLTKKSIVSADSNEILSVARNLLTKKNIENIKKYVGWFFSAEEISKFDWTKLNEYDIAYLMTGPLENSMYELGKKISDWVEIYPTLKVTDYNSFWRYLVATDKRAVRVSNDGDAFVFKSFLNVVWDNDQILKVVADELKKVDVQIGLDADALNKWDIIKTTRVDDMIQNAINSLLVISREEKTAVITFINKFLQWDTAKLNKLESKFRKRTVSNVKIASLWNALDYYSDIIAWAKKNWIDIDKAENHFADIGSNIKSKKMSDKKIKKLMSDKNKKESEAIDLAKERDIIDSKILSLEWEYAAEVSPIRQLRLQSEAKSMLSQQRKIENKLEKTKKDISNIDKELDNVNDVPNKTTESISNKKKYNINWGVIDAIRWVDAKNSKTIASWLVSSIVDRNFVFGSDISSWVSKFVPNPIIKKVEWWIKWFENKYLELWEWVDLQYAIYWLNDRIRWEFNKVAVEYWDLIRYVWWGTNDFINLFYKWLNIPVKTQQIDMVLEIEKLKAAVKDNLTKMWWELNTRQKSKTIEGTVSNMLTNWYTSVYDWKNFVTITIEDSIKELIELNKSYDVIFKNYNNMVRIDRDNVKFKDKQKWFSWLYTTHFGRKMVASLDDVALLIKDKAVWDLAKWLVSEYGVITKDWITMPKIFFDAFAKNAALDTAKNAKIFDVIKEWYKKKWDSVVMWDAINNKIDQVFSINNPWDRDELKELYSIYPKLVENKTTRALVTWERIKGLDDLVNDDVDSILSFNEYKDILQKYSPTVEVNWQDVYNMWYADTINANSFIPKQLDKNKYSKNFNKKTEAITWKAGFDLSDFDLDQYTRC